MKFICSAEPVRCPLSMFFCHLQHPSRQRWSSHWNHTQKKTPVENNNYSQRVSLAGNKIIINLHKNESKLCCKNYHSKIAKFRSEEVWHTSGMYWAITRTAGVWSCFCGHRCLHTMSYMHEMYCCTSHHQCRERYNVFQVRIHLPIVDRQAYTAVQAALRTVDTLWRSGKPWRVNHTIKSLHKLKENWTIT